MIVVGVSRPVLLLLLLIMLLWLDEIAATALVTVVAFSLLVAIVKAILLKVTPFSLVLVGTCIKQERFRERTITHGNISS